ncbi:MAG: KamA family radical SAM protein [Deltaproteobacteria bacterium]|nr:KamA family radical SAM protein [Deltaproteobacteria bacterium]
MERWQKTLSESITSLDELARFVRIDIESLRPVIPRYPLRITRTYLSLIQKKDDPIGRQCIPDQRELEQDDLSIDPLNEKDLTVAPGLIHRYPDRVVLLVSSACPTLCRFCTRKNRMGGEENLINRNSLKSALEYIKTRPSIREVILSGGDPLLLSDDELETILTRLRKIPHLEIVRLHTRAPVTLSDRITDRLCRMLKQYHPIYLNTQFNHPIEITPLSTMACTRLADAGIPLGNQTVLLKGVNDDPEVMKQLMQKLLTIRVRPYYIHQMDLVKGTGHFRTSIQKGLNIMAGLRGYTSGMATPSYVVDLPGGKGKVPFLPDDVKRLENIFYLRNYLGEVVEYPDINE